MSRLSLLLLLAACGESKDTSTSDNTDTADTDTGNQDTADTDTGDQDTSAPFDPSASPWRGVYAVEFLDVRTYDAVNCGLPTPLPVTLTALSEAQLTLSYTILGGPADAPLVFSHTCDLTAGSLASPDAPLAASCANDRADDPSGSGYTAEASLTDVALSAPGGDLTFTLGFYLLHSGGDCRADGPATPYVPPPPPATLTGSYRAVVGSALTTDDYLYDCLFALTGTEAPPAVTCDGCAFAFDTSLSLTSASGFDTRSCDALVSRTYNLAFEPLDDTSSGEGYLWMTYAIGRDLYTFPAAATYSDGEISFSYGYIDRPYASRYVTDYHSGHLSLTFP